MSDDYSQARRRENETSESSNQTDSSQSVETEETRGGRRVLPQQAHIVDHVTENGVTVVGAGAGTGKTYTTVATVLHLIEEEGAHLDEFALITFTNKAANSLKADISEAIRDRIEGADTQGERFRWRSEQERINEAYIGTIHGFCRRLLRQFGYQHHIARDAEITFSGQLRDDVFYEQLRQHLSDGTVVDIYGGQSLTADYEVVGLAKKIHGHVRSNDVSFEDLRRWTEGQPDDQGKPYRVEMARFIEEAANEYERRKRAEQVLDAHDLLEWTADLLEDEEHGAEIAARITDRYRYLFVDEFQDTDAIQRQIVEELLPTLHRLLVVGDRKQSIYGFRASQPELLTEFADEHTGGHILPLRVSFRATRPFLRVANTLFDEIGTRDEYTFLQEPLRSMRSDASETQPITPFRYTNAGVRVSTEDRIRTTADEIRQLVGQPFKGDHLDSETVQPGHVVILARSNRTVNQYVTGLRNVFDGEIDVRPDAGEAYYRQPEILSTFYMLRAILNFPDDTALAHALETPYLRGVEGTDEARRLVRDGPSEANPLTEWLEYENVPYYNHLRQLSSAIRSATVPQVIERLYRRFDVRDYYRRKGDHGAVQNLERLRELARDLFSENQALTLQIYVNHLRNRIFAGAEENHPDTPSTREDDYPPYVRVMTIHSAKGLEFPIVVIPEVQKPITQRDPDNVEFMVEAEHGLEVELDLQQENEDGEPEQIDTTSDHIERVLAARSQRQRREEMRVLYVAVTRAEYAIRLIGSGAQIVNEPNDEYYSWKDELLRVQPTLENTTYLPEGDAEFIF